MIECIYFSAVTFITVGFESLVGLVLIAWSASFTYIEMERFWRADDMNSEKRGE